MTKAKVLSFTDARKKVVQDAEIQERLPIEYIFEVLQSSRPQTYSTGYSISLAILDEGESPEIYEGRSLRRAARAVAKDLRERGYPEFMMSVPVQTEDDENSGIFMVGNCSPEITVNAYPSQEMLQKFHIYLDRALCVTRHGIMGLYRHYANRLDAWIYD